MIRRFRFLGLTVLVGITWCINIYHLGVMIPPEIPKPQSKGQSRSQWIDKDRNQFGIHQLILSGSPYERGLNAGQFTQQLMDRQERELIGKLKELIPSPFLLESLKLLAIRWFWGIDAYIDPWMLQEMYGVSQSASHEFDELSDGYTRQLAYHGLHEVGQMAVDQGSDGMGCTVFLVPYQSSWVIGRNFDFEGGRVFDTEKILKWVFPDQGFAYVSVIWAGMVGVVTGVNENGVYLSLNAAGSTDFRRHGIPSTLVLLKALQNSRSVEEAVRIIRNETMFITDIFVAADRESKRAYRIEKSPLRTEVIPLEERAVVTNHLVSQAWENDVINLYRRNELTSAVRAERGENLLHSFPNLKLKSSEKVEDSMLKLLRDKGKRGEEPLKLGNRRAIDALISTHSVIYNAVEQVLYVSQGPGVSGPFTGFDLRSSFASRKPVRIRVLPRDPQVTDQVFYDVHISEKEVGRAKRLLRKNQCKSAWTHLEIAQKHYTNSSGFYSVLGDYYQCIGKDGEAKSAWRKALSLAPAYPKQIKSLKWKLNE